MSDRSYAPNYSTKIFCFRYRGIYEREKIIERHRRGKLHAAKKGKLNVLSGAPFGFYYQKSTSDQDAKYIVHIKESKIVKEAFNLYCNKMKSIGEIAKIFTEKKYATRTGLNFWERSVIWGMLRNPAYMGKAAFRKTLRVKRKKINKLARESKKSLRSELSSPRDRPQKDWIFITVPAIIDPKIFKIAQERLKENIKFSPRNNKKFNYLLSGIIHCKLCGYAIYGKPASNSRYKRLYYRYAGQDGLMAGFATANREKKQYEQENNERTLQIVRNFSDFTSKLDKNIDKLDFENKKKLVRLTVREVIIDSIQEEITVNHILSNNRNSYPLSPGSNISNSC
jgi:Recombinase